MPGLLVRLRAWSHGRRTVRRDRRGLKQEPESLYFDELLAPDAISFHIGASDGRHTYLMARASPHGRIFAFEPNGYSYLVLQGVLRRHRLTGVESIQMALSDRKGIVTLTVPIKKGGRAGRSFGVIGDATTRSEVTQQGSRSERVPTMTLDAFVAEKKLDRVDFIRMDIEGAEALALAGAAGTLDRWLPNLLIEIHPVSLRENFASDADTLTSSLLKRGYRMFGIEADKALRETRHCDTSLPWKDYFFLHPSRIDRLPHGLFRSLMSAPSGSTVESKVRP